MEDLQIRYLTNLREWVRIQLDMCENEDMKTYKILSKVYDDIQNVLYPPVWGLQKRQQSKEELTES